MPWTTDDPPSVAKNWTAEEKRKCVSAANAVIGDGGSDEDAIFACIRAAGKSKKQGASMPKDEKSNQVFFIDLALPLQDGKAFDGVAPGQFVDMWWREVEIKAEDFQTYLENTMDAIEHTRTEEGEVVGLPIDAKGHLDDEAAGWIVKASLVEVEKPGGKMLPVIQFVAKWTENGRALIEQGIRRMFSPTLNTKKKIILGGSLTNWPATRDEMGKVLLRPISLSEGGVDIELERQATRIEGTGLYAASLVSIEDEDGENGNEFITSNTTSVAGTSVSSDQYRITATDISGVSETVTISDVNQNSFEGASDMEKMEFTQEELDAYVRDQVDSAVADLALGVGEPKAEGDEGDEQRFSLIEALNLGHLEDEAIARIEESLAGEYKRLQAEAEERYLSKLAFVNHKRDMTNLATRLVNGSDEFPRGLPIQSEQLVAGLLALPKDQVPFWRDLMTSIVTNGLVEFTEIGNEKEPAGTLPLPEEYAKALRSGELSIEALSNPMLQLGDLSKYDLTEFKK